MTYIRKAKQPTLLFFIEYVLISKVPYTIKPSKVQSGRKILLVGGEGDYPSAECMMRMRDMKIVQHKY